MNERIKELAEQAKSHADYYAMLSDSKEQDIFIENFAKLIIKDCANLAKILVMDISNYRDAEFVEKDIKEYFGIKDE